MRNDLMAEEIKVHPFVAGTSFGTTQQIAIEGARFVQIADGKRKMKTRTL